MDSRLWSRVLGALGLVLLLSAAVTALVGVQQLVLAKVALGLAGVVASLALGERGGARRFFTGRAAQFGLSTAVSAALVVGILAVAGWVVHRRPLGWDLTRDRIWTLSEDTTRTLAGLAQDVEVRAFYGQADPGYRPAQDLLQRYAARSPRFRVRMVDPYQAPEEARQLGITATGPRIVLTQGPRQARVGEPGEAALTQALVRVTRAGVRRLYCTVGHGEPDLRAETREGYSLVVRSLEGEGYALVGLGPLLEAEVPADAAAVLVVAPRTPFLPRELAALQRYADRGGHLGLFLEPGANAGLDPLLQAFGIEADEDLVLDPSPAAQVFGGNAFTPVVHPTALHPISRELVQAGLVFSTARSLVGLASGPVRATPLALTGPDAWGETDLQGLRDPGKGAERDEGEKGGPLPVAMAAERPVGGAPGRPARLVAVGDADFFSNGYQQLAGNRDFALNAVSWLAEQEDRITERVRSRDAAPLLLNEAQVATLRFLTLDALPVLLLGLGLAVWLVRRSR